MIGAERSERASTLRPYGKDPLRGRSTARSLNGRSALDRKLVQPLCRLRKSATSASTHSLTYHHTWHADASSTPIPCRQRETSRSAMKTEKKRKNKREDTAVSLEQANQPPFTQPSLPYTSAHRQETVTVVVPNATSLHWAYGVPYSLC